MVFNAAFYDGSFDGGDMNPFGIFTIRPPAPDTPQLEEKRCKKWSVVPLGCFLYVLLSTVPKLGNSCFFDPVRNDMKHALKQDYPKEYYKIIDSYHGPVDSAAFNKFLDKSLAQRVNP